jgi:hypothetical protein
MPDKINFTKVKDYNSHYHFTTKSEIEKVLRGDKKRIAIFEKTSDSFKYVGNGADAKLNPEDETIEVAD